MASCEKAPQISAYHDGELPPGEAAALEAHLGQCEVCREELARLEAVSQWLSLASPPKISEAAVARLRGSFQPARERAVLRTARALTAAAAAVLVLCSVQLWRQGRAAPVQPGPGWESAAVMTAPATEAEEDVDLQLAQSILGSFPNGGGYGHE